MQGVHGRQPVHHGPSPNFESIFSRGSPIERSTPKAHPATGQECKRRTRLFPLPTKTATPSRPRQICDIKFPPVVYSHVRRPPVLSMTTSRGHRMIRARVTWVAFMILAFCTPRLWGGPGIFTEPFLLLGCAPYGLIHVLSRFGMTQSPQDIVFGNPQSNYQTTLVCGLHILFWPLFLIFLWRLPRLSAGVFRASAISLALVVLTTLGGCYSMSH